MRSSIKNIPALLHAYPRSGAVTTIPLFIAEERVMGIKEKDLMDIYVGLPLLEQNFHFQFGKKWPW